MSVWYKMEPIAWNDGTENLTLEQEAAYLRICNAIYIAERPVRANPFVLAGLFRCNERRAQRLLDDLVEAGKLTVDDGLIVNRRAMNELSTRRQISFERKSAGVRGGIESAKARAKPLENNETPQAIASTTLNQIREEEKRVEKTTESSTTEKSVDLDNSLGSVSPKRERAERGTRLPGDWRLPKGWGEWAMAEFPQLTVEDVRRLGEDFRDYWTSLSGSKATKRDWEATWRNSVRMKAPTIAKRQQVNGHTGPPLRGLAAVADRLRRDIEDGQAGTDEAGSGGDQASVGLPLLEHQRH